MKHVDDITEEIGLKNIASAICLQACTDYIRALCIGDKDMQEDCEKFFGSIQWTVYTDMDGLRCQHKIQRGVEAFLEKAKLVCDSDLVTKCNSKERVFICPICDGDVKNFKTVVGFEFHRKVIGYKTKCSNCSALYIKELYRKGETDELREDSK